MRASALHLVEFGCYLSVPEAKVVRLRLEPDPFGHHGIRFDIEFGGLFNLLL